MTTRGIDTPTDSRFGFELDHYDLLLTSIPVAFLVTAAASLLAGISLEVALFAGSLVGILAMIDGMVLRPPNGHGGV